MFGGSGNDAPDGRCQTKRETLMTKPFAYLTRHGETAFNQEGRYQGQCDSPLTELGRQQATAVARLLSETLHDRAVRLVTSPLGRAQATAEIYAGILGTSALVEVDERLTEVGMGDWDGLTRAEIAEHWPDARRGRSTREWMFHAPGGERLEDVTQRISSALKDLKREPTETQIIVSHAVVGRVLRSLHTGMPILDALKLDAPQDAAIGFLPDGQTEFFGTPEYWARQP